jgi:hypothetical protein
MRPMGVSVHYKRGKPWLRSGARKSLLGDGMLERARATSLALLGVTAAIGLAMVALALNQSWPVIPGAPIPGFGDQQQAIGDAAVAAQAKALGSRVASLQGTAGGRGSEASSRPAAKRPGGTPVPVDSQPPTSESIVVADSTPASSPVNGPGGDASPAPPPTAQPVATPAQATAPTVSPEVSSPSQPPVDPVTAPAGKAPVPAAGTPPAESPEEAGDDDDPEEEEEEESDDDHGYSGGWRHDHGHGHW